MLKKREDGRYAVTAVINGKRKYFYGSTQKKAIEQKEAYLKKVVNASNFDGTITLAEWAFKWLEIKKGTVKENTLYSYKEVIKRHILPYLGSITLANLSVTNVRLLLTNLEGYSTRTIRYTHTILNAMIKQAVDDEIIGNNVVAKVKKPLLVKTKQMSTLTKEEVQAFLDNISDPEHYALFLTAFATGLRRSELLGLTWADVDLKKGVISVTQTVVRSGMDVITSKTTKTASSRRSISIDNKTLATLKKHRLNVQKRMIATYGWRNNDLVFPGEKGDPRYPTHVSHLCKKYAKLINRADFSFHGIRHTHVTLLLENGVNFKVIQMRLGHSSIVETMNTYAHITPSVEADVVEKIFNVLS